MLVFVVVFFFWGGEGVDHIVYIISKSYLLKPKGLVLKLLEDSQPNGVGVVPDVDNIRGVRWMYPRAQRTPSWEIPINKPYNTWVFMGYNPQESLENTINIMGTLLGVHPNCPLKIMDMHGTYNKY